MTRQELGLFSFDPPPEWQNRAVLVFVGASNDASPPPNIVVTRDDRRAGEDLKAHAWRSAFELGKKTNDFQLLGSCDTTIDGQPAFRMAFRWESERGRVEQVIVWIDGDERTALRVTCTAINRRDAFDELENMLASLRVSNGRMSSTDFKLGPTKSSPPPPPESTEMFAGVPMPGASRRHARP
jgi:hypothetical protein